MPGDLKHLKTGQEKNTSYSQGSKQPAQTEDKDVTGTEQSVLLPPFPLLLEWLKYYHAQTGSWPEPEANNNLLTVHHNSNLASTLHAEKPFLTLLPHKTKNRSAAIIFANASTYDFKVSLYYRVALDLVEENHISTTGPVREEIVLTLASLLAWCCYPSFTAEYKDKGFGMGMYLPLGQWSKELRMRKATLGNCLKELEEAGLIEICVPTTNATKAVKRFYRLAVPIHQLLPIFDPNETTGATIAETTQGESLQSYNDPEPLISQPEPDMEFPSAGTEPMIMPSQINNYKHIKSKTIEHEHGALADTGTTEEKLEFLSQVACFPGYTSPDGLIALDSREALKFASNSALDLFTLRKIYHQVLSAWSIGKCTRNPIGFFHYALTRQLKQKPSSFSNRIEISERMRFKAEPYTGTYKEVGSRFRPVSTPINTSNLTYQISAEELAGSQEEQSLQNNSDNAKQLLTLNLEKIQQVLQERVVEALKDRFKQPELAETLTRFKWEICLSGSKLRLQLEGQMADYLALGQGELALLKIVVSQVLKRLYDGFFDVEILAGL